MYQVTDKSTAFGIKTPFGLKTPFKMPSASSGSFTTLLSDLAMQLYPTGRAFNILKDSIMDKIHLALNISFIRLIEDAQLTIDSCFPDNDNFSEADCSLWEYRFGMVTNTSLSVQVRREAILRRMSRGKNIRARQHIKYIEYQLQLAGFDVYLYENGFIESGVRVFKRPQDILALMTDDVQHAMSTQHGIGVQHGGISSEVIANSYKRNELYSVDDEYLWATFFIAGPTLGTAAEVPETRLEEFRELVLKLKPAHLIAFTFIDYNGSVQPSLINRKHNSKFNLKFN